MARKTARCRTRGQHLPGMPAHSQRVPGTSRRHASNAAHPGTSQAVSFLRGPPPSSAPPRCAHLFVPATQMARSFVILPASMVSITAASRSLHHSASAALSSSLARCARPRVQAKMDATGFVLVALPFWNSRQWRVTVPAQNTSQPAVTVAHASGVVAALGFKQ